MLKHRILAFILIVSIVLPSQAMAADAPNATTLSQTIAQHLLNQEKIFTLQLKDSTSMKQMDTIFQTALKSDDYIRYNYSGYHLSAQQTKSNGMTFTFTITYLESKIQTAYVKSKVKEILDQIIEPGMNDYQKEKAIHDYIVSHIAYDISLTNYSAYAALTKGVTVCQGFALLTYRMLTDAGITNRIVEGYAGGRAHAWNEVNLDNHWYQLDTTWDDPVPFVKGRVLYTYFNVTSAELQKDHTWTQSNYPAANTSFQTTLKDKIKSDPSHAKVYQDLQKTLGYLKNEAITDSKTAVITTALLLQERIETAISKKKPQLSLQYKLASRNLIKDLQSAVVNKTKWGVTQVEYTSKKGSNGVITLELYFKYK
jgi:transglutaminase/protease-like cytokinesis protein 3